MKMKQKEKVTEYIDHHSYRSYVKKDKWKEFEKQCEINSKDPYCIAVVMGVHQVLRCLEWGGHFPPMLGMNKPKKLTPSQAMDEGIKSTEGYGISISQANFIVQDVIKFAKTRGEEFKIWWNKKHGGTGKEDGVVISNVIAIDITKKKKDGQGVLL